MEDEIKQTIFVANHNAQVTLFEALKKWQQEPLIADVHVRFIEALVSEYNDELNAALESVTKEKVKEYQTKYSHLQEGEEYDDNELLSLLFKHRPKKIYHKIYCIETIPDFIDTDYLPDYFTKLNRLLVSLRSILDYYINLYDQGKIKSSDSAFTNFTPQPTRKLLLAPGTTQNKKLKVNLSVPQLAYLFKVLNEDGVIEASTFTEIHEFIASNFIVKTKTEDVISAGKLKRIWSDFGAKTAAFWVSKFIDLHNLSKKDNPNNIKLKG